MDEVRQEEQTSDSDPAPVESPWLKELASDAWVRTVPQGKSLPPHRWHHQGVGQLLALDDAPEVALAQALDTKNPVAKANAAIGLSRLGNTSGLIVLVDAVENREFALRQRQAAVEALGDLDTPSATVALLELNDRLGRFDQEHVAAYHPDLHAELLRSLHDWSAEQVPGVFQSALDSPNNESRVIALQAWAEHPDLPLPKRVVALRQDTNPQIRAAAITALAAHRPENIERYLDSGLRDFDRDVRLAAIAGLGTVGTEASVQQLHRVMREEPEVFRAAAVNSLATLGDSSALAVAAEDDAWRVRLQAARDISHFATTESIQLADKLLRDSNIEVQQAVVEAVERWPLDVAGNVLFAAMASETYRTRSSAAVQLARRWSPAGEFQVDDSKTQRGEWLASLRTRWIAEFGEFVSAGGADLAEQTPTASHLAKVSEKPSSSDLERVQLILQQLDREGLQPAEQDRLLAELAEQGPTLVATLEHLSATTGQPFHDEIYRQVLPRVSPLFEAIEGVSNESAVERRAAANRLIEHHAELSASELAGERLFEQMIIHSDPLVWRSVLLATEQSSTAATTRIVQAAAGHASAEVRRRACEHMARFPRREYEALLSTMVTDADAAVVKAAANALGSAEQLDDPQPLRWLLRSDDGLIQLTAATALVRHHDADGVLALQRLAADPDPNIRILVANQIGRLGQQKLTAILIAMLDDRAVVRRTALDSLETIQEPAVIKAIRAEGHETQPQLAAAWKNWWRAQQRTARETTGDSQSAPAR